MALSVQASKELLCSMKWKLDRLSILVIASTLAMAGLVIFQYKWIQHSRELYDEVFHQRACMALCSTLEEYGEGAICNNASCATLCTPGPMDEVISEGAMLVNNEHFQNDLRKTLDFYNIDLSYQMAHSAEAPVEDKKQSAATCVVNVPAHSEAEEDSYIILDFPNKQSFMLEKMQFMIGASLIILFFTAIVLLVANWWLMKQKKLLQTNVEMYNNMAHEFRTPLTNIGLAASMLSNSSVTGKNNKFLDIISRENGRLVRQVERVLDIARLDNGEYSLHHERIQLRSLLEEVLSDLDIQIEEKDAIITFDTIPQDLEIFGDNQHLTNVFRNLIDNALKYATVRPVISITASESQKSVVIGVQDNGIGIPSSKSKMIFEKFQRVGQGNLHEQKGFGLGLAYVKKIVELHKGSIEVDSEVNKGSRFQVSLPKFC